MTAAAPRVILAALGAGTSAPDLRHARRSLLVRAAWRRSVQASLRDGGQASAVFHPAADRGAYRCEGFAASDLAKGEPTIVNVWASWCVPCHEEHPLLLELAKQPGVHLYGINYKDDPAAARRFLGRYGNPFSPGRRRPVRPRGHRLWRLWRA